VFKAPTLYIKEKTSILNLVNGNKLKLNEPLIKFEKKYLSQLIINIREIAVYPTSYI